MVPLDASGRIDDDLPCRGCGFNLRMQPATGACPECGGDVAPAVHRGLLRHRDPAWLRRTLSGLTHLVAGIAFALGLVACVGVILWLVAPETPYAETFISVPFLSAACGRCSASIVPHAVKTRCRVWAPVTCGGAWRASD